MKIRVLGSAAGGGFPQWNCNCSNCEQCRAGAPGFKARTQSSIAVIDEKTGAFALVNASPDVGTQLRRWNESQPQSGVRDTPLAGVVLCDSQIDHSVGLLSLREANRLNLYCTDVVLEDLTTQLPIINILRAYTLVNHYLIEAKDSVTWQIDTLEGVSFRAILLPGKPPPYCSHDKSRIGHNLALEIQDRESGGMLLYAPGLKEWNQQIEEAAARAACILIDGTFWTDDEMSRLGISKKTAHQMGHLYLFGAGGLIENLERFPQKRRILIHINNTNPILDPNAPERKQLEARGVEVAQDEMEFSL